ncbi:MAG: AmmeMemoRadiSam system radical SAM enzyme [Candidatus Omnitrophota bacterium]
MKKEAMFFERLDGKAVHCFLCAHQCRISPGNFGVCGVRQNIDGTLFTLVYGEVIASHVDPIEKKPLYHFLPGSISYSIATLGCNFKCGFCQNWQISQNSKKGSPVLEGRDIAPEIIVKDALNQGCKSISYTYTEPTIFFEYAYDTSKLAKESGLYNVFVTNGFMTVESLETIRPFLDAVNIDLKSFRDEYYRRVCKARLEPVLKTIEEIRKMGIWMEITTLVITNENDSEEELNDIAEFISRIDPGIPWHISRFHPDYQFSNYSPTPIETLRMAYDIGKRCGLKYVYLGNVSEKHNTYCFNCQRLLIERAYMGIYNKNLKSDECKFCGTKIEGVWG